MDKEKIGVLVQEAAAGSQEAFEQLYHLTRQQAYFVAFSVAKNEADAKDILQESYLKAYQNLARLEQPERFSAWLNRITANQAKNYISRRQPESFAEYEGESAADWQEETDLDFLPDERMDLQEIRALVGRIVTELPEDQRLCVLLRYYDDMEVAEIAQALELPEGTVKSRLSRARKKIAAALETAQRKGFRLFAAAPIPLFAYVIKLLFQEAGDDKFPPLLWFGAAATAAGATGAAATAANSASGAAAGSAGVSSGGAAAGGAAVGLAVKIIAAAAALILATGGAAAGVYVAKQNSARLKAASGATGRVLSEEQGSGKEAESAWLGTERSQETQASASEQTDGQTNGSESLGGQPGPAASAGQPGRQPGQAATEPQTAVPVTTAPATTAAATTAPPTTAGQTTKSTASQNWDFSFTSPTAPGGGTTKRPPFPLTPTTTRPTTTRPPTTTQPSTTTAAPTTAPSTRPPLTEETEKTEETEPSSTAPSSTTKPGTFLVDGGYIVQYNGYGGMVVVPYQLNGSPVIGIASEAFRGSKVTIVYIAEGIQSIGNGAFCDCKDLYLIHIPATVKAIGENAFAGCTETGDKQLEIICAEGSYAHKYAVGRGMKFRFYSPGG
ncbi:MAG: sigma-70 family RNA polymerase sigma factor [Oscillospiraceae bacterium]|jgi:RNA polymerase sigma factor (sigma-70 family)|nr:sigma-70 family RNA polymerase sigma factor [Oscillospiraceae bacterium]